MECLDAPAIAEIRDAIYLGPGYCILRNYLDPVELDHVYTFWRDHHNAAVKPDFSKLKDIYVGCPDATHVTDEVTRHYNFFWNEPRDPPTYSAAWRLQAIRNQIEGCPPDHEYLPHSPTPGERPTRRYAASYRITYTRHGGVLRDHCDWGMDHSRVQLSLMLTTWGQDYQGGGTILYDRFRGGSPRNICEEENLQAGDLFLFRYSQKHGVTPITTPAGGRGYCRILMPHELLDLQRDPRREPSWQNAAHSALQSLRMARQVVAKRLRVKAPAQNGAQTKADDSIRHQTEELYYDEDESRLMNIAVREGMDPCQVFNHRGLWGRFKTFQNWQMQVLQKHGLQPEHHFLDIGCGILRLGMPLIQYLDDDRYCGIDPVQKYLDLGHVYLRDVVETQKQYHLSCNHEFNFDAFGRKFDFAMAQSVFTHLSFEQIEHCFQRLQNVMNPGGRFIFTILLGQDQQWTVVSTDNTPMTKSSHKDISFYEELAQRYGFTVRLLGPEGHPTQHACLAEF